MSDTQKKPWSDNPNAPKIPYDLYLAEKANLAGTLIAAVLYGALIVLFFKCMALLLKPVNRKREGIKWGLVSYTVVMFACGTIVTGMGQNMASVSFIDNREFPGVEGVSPPGPLGYLVTACSTGKFEILPTIAALLNYWLADGLLLYRCYILFGKSLWVIAFPCLVYLAAIAMGIVVLASQACGWGDVRLILPHLSVSVLLNVLLTLMIVIRLVLHDRDVRAAIGSPTGMSRLYKTIVTMLIESCALYAVISLLLIGLWAAGNAASGIFLPLISVIQVIAPLLIVQRVANRSALTSNTIVTGNISSFHARGRGESTGGNRTLPSVHPMGCDSADNFGKISGMPGVHVIETTIDLRRDSEV